MITQNRNEITAVRENKAKMVALNQRDAQTKWGQLEVFMTQWRRVEALISESGPFIWRASRTAMASIPLSYPPSCPSPDHRLAGGPYVALASGGSPKAP